MKKLSPLRALVSIGVASCALAPAVHGQMLVNDQFNDMDRIGGMDGSSTTADSPTISTPTATNTQWVASSTGQLVASGSGLAWTMNSTSNRMALGYFPKIDLTVNPDVMIHLGFTTGSFGSSANSLRIALVDGSPAGPRTTDSFNSTDASYVGDMGYAIFAQGTSSGNVVGGGNTDDLNLRVYKRTVTGSNNILGTSGDWGTQLVQSAGSTGYLDQNTAYDLGVHLVYSGGMLTITTSLTGGNFSGLTVSTTDSTSPVTAFDTLALRFGGGSGQYDAINFDYLTATAAVPEPSTYAAFAGALALGFVALRRRRKA